MKNLFILGVICLLCSISAISQSKKEWERVQTLNKNNVYQQFINNYPNGKYTELAKQKLAQLKGKEVNVKKVETNKVTEVEPVGKDNVVIQTVKSQTDDQIVLKKNADNLPDYYYSPNEGSISKGKISQTQNGTMALRAGGGLILEESTAGFACALDFKVPMAPVVLSPFFQSYSNSGMSKQYYGANIQLAKQLSKGFFIGVGGGMARWSYDGTSRTSLSISPLLGIRIKIIDNFSLFTEGKMFINTKTNQDTNDWNSGQSINGPLFDNDFTATIGLEFLLK